MSKRSCLTVVLGAATALSSGLWLSPAAAGQLFSSGSWQNLDFEQSADGTNLSAGTDISSQWADWGLELSATSDRRQGKHSSIQDMLTLYDSSTLGGKDNDLVTGQLWQHRNNGKYSYKKKNNKYNLVNTGRNEGNLLIVQENEHGRHDDTNPDGTLVNPDDEGKGGEIDFSFSESVYGQNLNDGSSYKGVELGKIRLVDIDENPDKSHVSFRLFSGTQELFLDKTQDGQFVLSETRDSVATAQDLFDWTTNNNQLVENRFAGIDHEGNNSIWDFNLGAFKLQDGSDAFITKLTVDYQGSGAIAGLGWRERRESSDAPQEVPEPTALAALGLVVMGALKIKRKPIA